MRKIVLFITFVCLLEVPLCGFPKFYRVGRRLTGLSGKVLRQEARRTLQQVKIGKFFRRPTKTQIPTTPIKPFSTVKQQQLAIQAPSLPTNTISRRMQRQVALEMRPFLCSFEDVHLPEQAASFDDEYFGVMTMGNLTKMSQKQYKQAIKEYEAAMDALQGLSRYANTTIFYMGTSETPARVLEHFQIEQMNKEIMHVGELVDQAHVSWGEDPVLKRATFYLHNLTQFYRILGTGIYEKIGEQEKIIPRMDGHVYNSKEFGLTSEILEAKIPQWHLMDPATWFTDEARGVLPHGLRVAILQDDKDVIRSIHEMQKKAGLHDWEIDFYDDPEKFLNQVIYDKYDMILTDVLIQNGGGRYLARQLRSRGYEGSILTLSGFEASVHSGEAFFADGIDGMIAFNWTNDIAGRIWTRLNNYFMLKEKYGWKH